MCLALLPISFLALSSPIALGALPDPAALSFVLTFSLDDISQASQQQGLGWLYHQLTPLCHQLARFCSRPLHRVKHAISWPHFSPGHYTTQRLKVASSVLPPIPVKRVQALQFVELKELLPVNINLSCQLDACLDSPVRSMGKLSPTFKDVSSILSWGSCYVLYVAVLAEAHPEQVKSRVVYLTLIIADARHNRGDRYLMYDSIFRCNVAEDPTVGWGKLDPRHKTTVVRYFW